MLDELKISFWKSQVDHFHKTLTIAANACGGLGSESLKSAFLGSIEQNKKHIATMEAHFAEMEITENELESLRGN
jgi:hypothetical protein